MTQKTKGKKLAMEISKNLSKQKSRASVKAIIFYCVPCSRSYTAIRKNEKGEMVEQQVCQHTTLKKVLIK